MFVGVVYLLVCELLQRPSLYETFFSPHRLHVMCHTFVKLLSSFMPRTFQALNSIEALNEEYLSLIFNDFFVELLPPVVLQAFLDAFLFEGCKILYRYALALIFIYKHPIKRGHFKTGEQFWVKVKSDAYKAAGILRSGDDTLASMLGLSEKIDLEDEHRERGDGSVFLYLKVCAFDEKRSSLQKLRK